MKKSSKLFNLIGFALAGRRLWAILFALPAGIVVLGGCGKAHQDGAATDLPLVQVRTETAQARPLASVEEVMGTVRATLHATIEAKISGRLTGLPVIPGQRIRAGDLLARLEAPEVKARLEQAEAEIQQAERDAKRMTALFNQQAATRADYETADSRYLVAKGALAEARAMMGFVEILAPFDGVVSRKWVDAGDQATPGKPLLEVEDPAQLQLAADVPEAMASRIKLHARMLVRSEHTGDISATVAEIPPSADPASRTLRVKLDLPASPGLMSGQFARLIVPLDESPSMRVPASAVVQRGQMELLFVVENRRARLHLVKTGRRVNNEMEILSGLGAAVPVVIDNPQQLVDGQPVEEK